MNTIKCLIMLTVLFHFNMAIAGQEVGNGGFVIECKNKPLMVLDYYEATLPTLNGTPTLLSLREDNLEHSKSIIYSRLSHLSTFYGQILGTYESVLNTDNWIMADLDLGKDDTNLPYKDCIKKSRVARRQGKTVYVQKGLVSKLGKGQQFVLALHEFLYASSQKTTSEKTRHVIRELLKSEEEYDQSRFKLQIEELFSRWGQVTYKKSGKFTEGSDSFWSELNGLCKGEGSEFAVSYTGKSRTQPNCGGLCTTLYLKTLTCAALN